MIHEFDVNKYQWILIFIFMKIKNKPSYFKILFFKTYYNIKFYFKCIKVNIF